MLHKESLLKEQKWNRGLDFDSLYQHYFDSHKNEFINDYIESILDDDYYVQDIMDENELSAKEEVRTYLLDDINEYDIYNYFEDDIINTVDDELQSIYDSSYNKLNNLINSILYKFRNKFKDIRFTYDIQESHSWNAGKFPSIYFTIHIENDDAWDDIDIRLSDRHDNGRNDSDLEFSWYEDDYNKLDLNSIKEQIVDKMLDLLDCDFNIDSSIDLYNELCEDYRNNYK